MAPLEPTAMSTLIESAITPDYRGAGRVLILSTIAFTLLFEIGRAHV